MPTRLVGSAQEITDRKLGEEKIHNSEALLAQAEQLANLGSWEWEMESGSLVWSDNMYRLRATGRDHRFSNRFPQLLENHGGMRARSGMG
jgi:hypothetical protein